MRVEILVPQKVAAGAPVPIAIRPKMIGATCAVEPCSLLSHEETGVRKGYPTPLTRLAFARSGTRPHSKAPSSFREAPMESVRHIVEWHGERFTIEPLKSLSRVTALSPTWAVFRRGEFIGTLPYRSNETPMIAAERPSRRVSPAASAQHDPSPRPRSSDQDML